MLISGRHIRNNERIDLCELRQRQLHCREVHVLTGAGRGGVLDGITPDVMFFAPLKGLLRIWLDKTEIRLSRGELLAVEGGLRVRATGSNLWIGIGASALAWRELVGHYARPAAAPTLLPVVYGIDRLILRAIIALAREIGTNETQAVRATATSVASMIEEMQSRFDQLIARCPGRTWQQRRNTLVRLQRAMLLMNSNPHEGLDVETVARAANYSPCHFIRTFGAVYGTTPHSHLMDLRLRRARELIHRSALAIQEVALLSGFKDRSAFARSFKKHFGITASSLRRKAACTRTSGFA